MVAPSVNVVAHADDVSKITRPGIYNAVIGKNRDPVSKVDDFSRRVTKTSASLDIAMMKLCYVDITRETDITQLFQYYASTIEELETRLPHLRFVHLTVPLRCTRLGIRSRLKQLAGQIPVVVDDNAQRQAYNALVRSRYGNDNCLFDLAAIESTKPSGDTCSIRFGDDVVQTMYPGYSDDGGHLNSRGSRIVAQKLIELIAEL